MRAVREVHLLDGEEESFTVSLHYNDKVLQTEDFPEFTEALAIAMAYAKILHAPIIDEAS